MSSCEQVCREFSCEKLTWVADDSRDFVRSEWRTIPPKPYTIFRVVIAVALTGWMIYDFTHESLVHYKHMPAYWFLFATNWAFLLFTIANVYQAVLCVIYNFRRDPTDPVCGYGPGWIIYEVSTSCVVVTSAVFWFDFASLSNYDLFVSPSSQVKHSLNAGLVALEILISAVPYRVVHFIYPVLGGVIYSLFNLVYWLLNGPSPLGTATIYPEINWARPGPTLGIIAVILFLILVMHCLLFTLQLLRRFMASLIYGPVESDESEAILKPSDSGYSAINSAPLPPTKP